MSMKTRYRKKAWLCAVLAAVLCLALALPQMNMYARGFIDETKPCTLKVTKDVFDKNAEDWADLTDTDRELEVYLYQIATVDSYGRYTVDPAFKSAAGSNYPNPETWDIEKLNDGVYEVSADDWRKEARYIAGILDLPIPPAADAGKEENGEDETTEKLVIPEEGALTSAPCYYKTVHTDEEVEVEQGLYLVWAKPLITGEYEYTFLPYLVSVPDYAYGREDDVNEDLDEWIYHVTVGLKPRRQVRYLNLEIVKTLLTYNASLGEGMFVFQVEAVRDERDANGVVSSKVVYSDMVGMNFSEPGRQSVLLKKIPAGSRVTIKEIYTGASYELTSWDGETWNPASLVLRDDAGAPAVVIDRLLGSPDGNNGGIDEEGIETAARAVFVNDYDETTIYGTGIVNHFTYSEDTKEWVGVQIVGGDRGEEAANE
jgi:hypothetical protein